MKFIISSSLLVKNLQAINGVIDASKRLPILENFLFELNNNNLSITASDLETTIKANMEVSKAEQNGRICIPSKLLISTLKTFADIPVYISVDEDTQLIEISAEEGKYEIMGFGADDFPKLPVLENGANFEINSDVLANAINKTIFATGTDELRPVMAGVFIKLFTDKILFVATDAHKLVKYARLDSKINEEASFIANKKPLNLLKAILSTGETAPVNVSFTAQNAVFNYMNTQLFCRLIEGKYPNYDAVIPIENPNVLTMDKQLIVNALRRISLFSSQATFLVKFDITGNEVILSAEDVDFSKKAKEKLPCSFKGDNMQIGFNSKFLLEMLNIIDSKDIAISMSEPNRASVITPAGDENKDEELLMLIMPVMLNQ